MNTYTNITGTKLEVIQSGKGFITRRHYEATKNTPSEVVEKNHKNYSQVEKIINKFGFVAV